MTTINTQGFGVQLAPAGFSLEANKIFENYEAALTFVRTKPAAYVGSVITVKAPSTIDEVTYPAGVYNVTAVGENGALEQVGKETDLSGYYDKTEVDKLAQKISIEAGNRPVVSIPEILMEAVPNLIKLDTTGIITEIGLLINDIEILPAPGSDLSEGVVYIAPVLQNGGIEAIDLKMTVVLDAVHYYYHYTNVLVITPPFVTKRGYNRALPLVITSAEVSQDKSSVRITGLQPSSDFAGMPENGVYFVGLRQALPGIIRVTHNGQYIPMEEVTDAAEISAMFGNSLPFELGVMYKTPALKADPSFCPEVEFIKL